MQSSSLRVYSIIFNCRDIIKKNKNKSIDKLVVKIQYDRSKEFYRNQCKRIYNEIENSFYNYNDLKLFLLYEYLFNDSIKLKNINAKNVKLIKKLFIKKQLNEDKYLILRVNKQTKYNDIKKYFVIREMEGGNYSIIYNLILKKYISPLFWIKYSYVVTEFENEEKDHKRFRKICNIMKGVLNENSKG